MFQYRPAATQPPARACAAAPPPVPTLRNVFDRLRANWRGYVRSLADRDRQFDADALTSNVDVFQRLKSLGAIDPATERILLGWFDACLDG